MNVSGGTGVGSISVISTQTRALSGAALQMAVATNPVVAEAYVTDQGPGATEPGETSTVSTTSKTSDPGDDVSVGDPGSLPTAVAVNPGGTKAYVTNREDSDVSVVDLTSHTLASPDIPVGGSPSAIAINPAGTKAYVTNSSDSTVTPINLINDTAGASINLDGGSSPSAVAFTPDGARAYVVNRGNDDVTAINAATNARIGSDIAVGNEPTGIALFTVPPAIPTQPPGGNAAVVRLPSPEPGETINLTPIEGTVTIKCAGETSFAELAAALQVPTGCVIDAREGAVELVAATALRAAARTEVSEAFVLQTALVSAGRFRLAQDTVRAAATRTVAPVTLELAGPLLARRVRSSGEPAADAAKQRRLERRRAPPT